MSKISNNATYCSYVLDTLAATLQPNATESAGAANAKVTMAKTEHSIAKTPVTFRMPPRKDFYKYMIVVLVMLTLNPKDALGSSCPGPAFCSCEYKDGKQIINCRHKQLAEVPNWNAGSSIPFYELTLAYNDITSLRINSFNELNIKRLDLSENPIVSIHDGAFNGLEANLEELVLHFNNMDRFPKEAIGKLSSLRLLTLKGLNIQTLPENALQTLSQLQILKLERCGLVSITAQDLTGVGRTLRTLALPFNELLQIPTSALSELESLKVLDLQHNKLKLLREGMVGMNAQITTLDFSNNEIATIGPNAFLGLEESLEYLVLKSNKLTENQLLPLAVLRNLKTLNLAINSIRNIPSLALDGMQKLHTLNLRLNNIAHLRLEPFNQIKSSLVDLELSQNEIIYLEKGFFQDFTALEVLQMENQNSVLTNFSASTFDGLERKLVRLDLGNTGFTTTNLFSIAKLRKLKSLSLNDNEIKAIPDMVFQHLTQLITLDLSNNRLTSISQGSFFGMQNSLVEINLVNNQLESIGECTFHEYTSLERIKLGKNPLNCDCNLVWLREWIVKFEDTINFFLIDWRCNSPVGLQNRTFRELTTGDLCGADQAPNQCKLLQLSTTDSTVPSGRFSTRNSPPQTTDTLLLINATELTYDAVLLSWRIKDAQIRRFDIRTVNRQSDTHPPDITVQADVRRYRMTDLLPETQYVTCITSVYDDPNRDSKSCIDIQTMKKAAALTQSAQSIGSIIGAVIGALAFIVLLIILVFLLLRSRGFGDTWLCRLKNRRGSGGHTEKSNKPTGIPRRGYQSKRFSRPKGATASTTSSQLQNDQNLALEKKLSGFSPEERDRILNALTTTGGSTASIISTGSSTRYVPELPPRRQSQEGYLNPQVVKDELNDPESHIYAEIPGAEGGYYEVPTSTYRDSGISTASGKYEFPYDTSRPSSGECYI